MKRSPLKWDATRLATGKGSTLLSGDPLESLAWEPCILKHGPNYEHPHQRDRQAQGVKIGQAVPICSYDNVTKDYTVWPSVAAFARKLGVDTAYICNIIRSGGLTQKRYSARRLTPEELKRYHESGCGK